MSKLKNIAERLLNPDKDEQFFTLGKDFPMNNDKEFSISNAYWMAELSRLAYVGKRSRITQELADEGFEVNFFYNDDTEAHVAWNDNVMICFFRGTEPTKFGDIGADLNLLTEKSNVVDGGVHCGFKDALDDIWGELETFISTNLNNRPLFLTGHSLGAALATLAASRLDVGTALYTYGSPRVGKKTLARFIDSHITHYRFVHNRDIVTRVPPAFLGYRHSGQLHILNKNGQLFSKAGMFRDAIQTLVGSGFQLIPAAYRWVLSRMRKGFVASAKDHSMTNYCEALVKLINNNT